MLSGQRRNPAIEHGLDAQKTPVLRFGAGPARQELAELPVLVVARDIGLSRQPGVRSREQRRGVAVPQTPARPVHEAALETIRTRRVPERSMTSRPAPARGEPACQSQGHLDPGRALRLVHRECVVEHAVGSVAQTPPGLPPRRLPRTRRARGRASRVADRGMPAASGCARRGPRHRAPAAARPHPQAPRRSSPATSVRPRPPTRNAVGAAPPARLRRSRREPGPHPARAGRAAPRACQRPWPPVRHPSIADRREHPPRGRPRPPAARTASRTRRSAAPHVPCWSLPPRPVRSARRPRERSAYRHAPHRLPTRAAPPDRARPVGFRQRSRTGAARPSRRPGNRWGPARTLRVAPCRAARAPPRDDFGRVSDRRSAPGTAPSLVATGRWRRSFGGRSVRAGRRPAPPVAGRSAPQAAGRRRGVRRGAPAMRAPSRTERRADLPSRSATSRARLPPRRGPPT